MKSTLIKYSLFGFLSGLLLFLILFQFTESVSEGVHLAISYFTMFVLALLVISATKQLKRNRGQINFKQAFTLSFLVCIAISLGVGLADYLFTAVIEPDFIDKYITKTLDTMSKTLSPEEFNNQKAAFLQQMVTFGSSIAMAFFMVLNVCTIGLIVSLITSYKFSKNS